MKCEKCGDTTHRDDAENRRCDGCERFPRICICMTFPCQPMGCDNGIHLAGCPFIAVDTNDYPADIDDVKEMTP